MITRCIQLVLVLVLAAAPAAAQHRTSVFGAAVRLELRESGRLSGELLAVEGDSLWLLAPGGTMHSLGLRDVGKAQVPQPGTSAGKILTWTAIGGLVTGGGLALACSSVEGAECGGVLAGVMVLWLVVGGASAALAGSGWRSLTANSLSLAPYARFPQGLPDGFTRPHADGASREPPL